MAFYTPIDKTPKSFLQSLTVDESVWFDNFFYTVICPLFYVETLADLEKAIREGRTPEDEVGIIARKFPDMQGAPNIYHGALCFHNLCGHEVPMEGRIVVPGARPVRGEGKTGFVVDPTAEAEAFSRWQEGKFEEVERLYAKQWRASLAAVDLHKWAESFRSVGIDGKSCKYLEEAKSLAESAVASRFKPIEQMRIVLDIFRVPLRMQEDIHKRWSLMGYPPLSIYAPYAAYVLTIDIFFQIALAANLLPSERPSGHVDISYLYYLPFCMMFVSSDKLHRKCTPLFLRPDQSFVWGPDLKSDLKRLNDYYASFSNDIKEKGIMSFASRPPVDKDFLVTRLWDRHLPAWRHISDDAEARDPEINKAIIDQFNKEIAAPTVSPEDLDFTDEDADFFTIQRKCRRRKGGWYLLPKDLKVDEGGTER